MAQLAPANAEQVLPDAPGVNSDDDANLRPQKSLNTLDVACLIINKMIGTGIFVTPATVTFLVGNKLAALFLWVFGGFYSLCSIYIYLEYGMAWPYNGGEFIYILKIFPRPPLVFACSFAWFFVSFSTSTGNALAFARFIIPPKTDEPNEWLMKFIGCGIVVAISLIHYRLVNIGILANNCLAFAKVTFLGSLVLAGFVATCRGAYQKSLPGTHDYTKTIGKVSPVNPALAILLVLFSYQGWENANYVTSEIKGNAETRRKILKRGALWAIGGVTGLYISFNFFLYFLLDFDTIVSKQTSVAAEYAVQTFRSKNILAARYAIYICIALSACGNLVGVIFTNVRVKRDIARRKLIPFYKFFRMSSKYGCTQWDGLGTPTGGLMLHGLVTCITIAATPIYKHSTEGQSFILNLGTYGHSILAAFLGFGLFFLPKRMNENETKVGDPPRESYDVPWNYKIFTTRRLRYLSAIFFILINGFLVILPCIPTDNPDGSRRHIPSWALPVTVIPMYALGALAGLYMVASSPRMFFRGGRDENNPHDYVRYSNRMWIVDHHPITLKHWWKDIFDWNSWTEIKRRLKMKGEANKAIALRRQIESEQLTSGAQQAPG